MSKPIVNKSQELSVSAVSQASEIAKAYTEATTAGAGKLTGKEYDFLKSIHSLAQKNNFPGLTTKQCRWFQLIAKKLETTRGLLSVEIIGKRHSRRFQIYRDSYGIACAGW